MPTNPSGPIRRSQLIAPFGVGSLINVPGGASIIIAGLDFWYKDNISGTKLDISEFRIEEWRLEELLNVTHFRLPPDYREFQKGQSIPNFHVTIPTFRFPTWYFCPDKRCRLLKQFPMTVRGRIECPECKAKGIKRFMFQVPFVAMCEMGHLQDFPFREWVHHDRESKCSKKLKLISTGSATLAGQKVICECGRERTLAGITSANPNGSTLLSNNLIDSGKYNCQGYKPWLGDGIHDVCNAPIRGSLRSSSNLYFANVISSLYLPKEEQPALQKLEELLRSRPLSSNIQFAFELEIKDPRTIAEKLKSKFTEHLMDYTVDQIERVMVNVFPTLFPKSTIDGHNVINNNTLLNLGESKETTLRRDEYNALIHDRNDLELKVEVVDIPKFQPAISQYFMNINLVKKLRETKTLTTFTRVLPDTELDYVQRQAILWNNKPNNDSWLPAYVVYGEGIFFRFDEDKLKIWEERQDIKSRIKPLVDNFKGLQEKKHLKEREITPRFILLHTFAHIVLNRLTYECGYSSAALRERLYVSNNPLLSMAGLLIYTADGDSEGTMGGLVRMGKPGNLEPVILRALENARWCSADPVCMEMGRFKGQGPDSCNLAACHNCALVPETACEEFNRFLDRGLLIGDHENPGISFFELT